MNTIKLLLIISLSYLVIACGGAEERKAAYLDKAEKYFNSGDLDKARIELKNVLQIDPKDARAYYKLGTIFERKQEFRQAFGNYSKAVELDPENNEYQSKIGRFYLVLAGDIEKATEKMELILSKDPNDVNGLLLKAGILHRQDKTDESIVIAKSLFEKHPDNIEVALFLSTLQVKKEQYDDAIAVLDKALTLNPDNENLLSTLANTLFVDKQFDRSEKVWNKILIAHPDVFKNHLSLALFYQKTQQLEKAETVLREAITADEDDVQRKLVLIEFLQQTKGNDTAISELTSMIKNNLKESSLRLALAQLQISANNLDAAIATYKTTASDFSNEEAGITARVMLAKIYMQKKDVDSASAVINEASEIAPNDAEVNLVKAKIALVNKNLEQAIIALRAVVKDKPDNIEAYILLTESHKANNEVKQAEDVLLRARENNRDNVKALMPLAKYFFQKNDFDSAESTIDDYIKLDKNNYEALSIKCAILNTKKDYKNAIMIAENIIKLYPDKENGYIQSVPSLLTDKKLNSAIEILSQGYERTNSIQILKTLSEVQIATGKTADIIEKLQQVEKGVVDESIQQLLAKAYIANNDISAAKQTLLNSIEADKTRVQSYLTLSSIYMKDNNNNEAIDILKKGLDAIPGNPGLGILLGSLYEKTGDVDAAIDIYENVLRSNSENLLATNNLAALLSDHRTDKESLDRAKNLADKIKNAPQPVIKDTVGWVYYKTGALEEAVDVLKAVIAASPEVPVFNYHLGMAYYKNGDKINAKVYLEKALSNNSDFEGASEARTTLSKL